MNIQEAYNKGLTDSENNTIKIFKLLLEGGECGTFINPELESVKCAIRDRFIDLVTIRDASVQEVDETFLVEMTNDVIDLIDKSLSDSQKPPTTKRVAKKAAKKVAKKVE